MLAALEVPAAVKRKSVELSQQRQQLGDCVHLNAGCRVNALCDLTACCVVEWCTPASTQSSALGWISAVGRHSARHALADHSH